MSGSIFLSYRRDDAGPDTQAISDALRQAFGDDSVFMDNSSIQAGAVWPEKLKNALKAAETIVVVIGPKWLQVGTDEWGRRRIDQEDDWVRQELALALKGKKVIPVLVRGAKIPPSEVLPEPLKTLPQRQSIEIRRDYWNHDIKLLIEQFGDALKGPEHPSRSPKLCYTRIDIHEGASCWRCNDSVPGPLLKAESAADDEELYAQLMHNRYYLAEYMSRSTRYVELRGRFEPEPNPILDIIVNTGTDSSLILLSCGIEVFAAQRRIISAGSVRKITLDPSEKYKVPFPFPCRVRNLMPQEGEPSTFKVEANQYDGNRSLIFGDAIVAEWEWADTPISSIQKIRDPLYIDPDTPYRFELEIEGSHRMPTDTLLHIVIGTNHGMFRSDEIYFIKP
ncbi:toll/interleukin-1 receptor domain-containing protein [Desulfobacter curvatus]|uniref:toll/interleukin-1 receptor domain-containing protein n=1 Tax=Desulfobacter curvatus TaxID=2290 RepID=UPI0003651F15|nr:toll/interleukin-1 receptor domain-containing protein [Desulfobacter curvatus]